MTAPVVEAHNLTRVYRIRRGPFKEAATLHAVGGVSFDIVAGRTLAVEVRNGRAEAAAPAATPTARLTMDAETYACLVCGRWTGEYALANGRVTVDGDVNMAEAILAHMATIP